MTVKIIKKGFGKKNFKVFKLNEKSICINVFGTAVFVTA